MLIPYSSDALLRHRPWATLGIIATNVLLFFVTDPLGPDGRHVWTLELGRFAPLQWIPSAFSHANLVHLIGNMIFLFVFGMIVEGRLGWRRYVPLYLAMAAASGLITQVLMLGTDPTTVIATGRDVYRVALGASGVIFGLMVIALVWAPLNEVRCLFLLFLGRYTSDIEIRIVTFGGIYVGLNLLGALLRGFEMSTSTLHLIGALTGVAPAWYALRLGIVDCEGWDVVSLWKNGWEPPGRRARRSPGTRDRAR